MATSHIERRFITSQIPTTPITFHETFAPNVPVPTQEERLRVSSIFADNMERLFAPRSPLPSLSSDVESDASEDEEIALVSASEPRLIRVRPKECDLKKLNDEIDTTTSLLQSISLATALPIDKEICDNLSRSVAQANPHILNHPKFDALKDELPSKTNDPDLYRLTVCQNLAGILQTNLRIIREILTRADNPPAIMHFRPGFGGLSYAIASESIATVRQLPEGAFGVTSLVTHSNGTCYVTKRTFTEADITAKHPTIPFYLRDDFLKNFKAKSNLTLAREISVDYSLPPSLEGVVKFFGVNKEGHLLLEYISGGELLDAIIAGKFKTIKQAYNLIKKLANTLATLHQINIIHCDVKPENVMLDDDLNPKIIDFGAARAEFTPQDLQEIIGTVTYLAPEIFNFGQPRDNKTDVWSLGSLLYTVITGRLLGQDLLEKEATAKALQKFFKKDKKILNQKITDLLEKLGLRKQKNPLLPRLYLALAYSLNVDPKERSTMQEIADLLNQ